MIKAIFLDIDGTLVSFKTHKVPSSAIKAIHEARQKGVKVFICTGRPPVFIDNLAGVENDGMVTTTGALCLDAEGHIIHRQSMPKEDLQNLVKFLHKQESPTPYIGIGSEQDVYGIHMDHPEVLQIIEGLKVPKVPVRPIEEMLEHPILQLMGFYHTEKDEDMMSLMPNCVSMRWHPFFVDVISKGLSKAQGIDKMIQHYNISLEETMAVGDGGNDIAMLDHVPFSVAMGNASDEVKQHAKFVTTHIDEDGLYNAFKHFNII